MIMLWQNLSYNGAQRVNISLDPEYTEDMCDVGSAAEDKGYHSAGVILNILV